MNAFAPFGRQVWIDWALIPNTLATSAIGPSGHNEVQDLVADSPGGRSSMLCSCHRAACGIQQPNATERGEDQSFHQPPRRFNHLIIHTFSSEGEGSQS
jgi:hypothetical protein